VSLKKKAKGLQLRLLTEGELKKLEKRRSLRYDSMDAEDKIFRIIDKEETCIGFLTQFATSRVAIIKESLCNPNDL